MTRTFCAVLGVALSCAAGASAAAPRIAPLPTPLQRLSTHPPLGSATGFEQEALRHRVRVVERVFVGVDRDGTPFSVSLVQRLTVLDTGDYNFTIPAPVVDVRAASGSDSQPGQRSGAILWAGFNPRRKVLAARARLRAGDTVRFLPLRIRVERSDGGMRITLRNATAVAATTVDADTDPLVTARRLDEIRSAVVHSRPLFYGGAIPVRGAQTSVRRLTEAPLRVRGSLSAGAGTRTVDVVLGDGLPLHATVALRGTGPLRLGLTVEPVPPLRTLTPPRGARWVGSGLPGRRLLRRATDALLRIARTRQYDTFLETPDPRTSAQTTYVYRVAQRPAPLRVAVRSPTRVGDRSATTLWLGLGVLLAGAAVFAWTRA